MKARYQLEKRRVGDGTIYVAVTIQGKRVRANTGLKLNPIYWNNGKPNQQQTVLNSKLNELSELIYIHSTQQAPTKQSILDLVEGWKQGKKDNLIYIDELIELYYKHNQFADRTKDAKTTHLEEFKTFAPNITANEITKGVLRDYRVHLISKFKGRNNNTINNYIKNLKALINWAFKAELIEFNHSPFLDKLPATEKEIIVISESELIRLEKSDFSHNKRLDRVKDLFLFVCYTGLRFGDIKQVQESKIIDSKLYISQEKTKALTRIPLIREAKHILTKYNYQLPIISNGIANTFLKEIFTELKLNRKVYVSNEIGIKPLNKVITFHVGRKSFITIALANGVPRDLVKQLSGHRSDKVFSRYVQFSDEQLDRHTDKLSRSGSHLRAV